MLRCRLRWPAAVAYWSPLFTTTAPLRQASTEPPRPLPYRPPPAGGTRQPPTASVKGRAAPVEGHNAVPSVAPPPRTHRGRFGSAAAWVVYALATFLGAHVFLSYCYSFDICIGISMMPTIFSFGDWVCISKYYRRGRDVAVGDVVSFKNPIRVGEYAVKRVIGLPGDFVLMNTPGKSDAMIQIPEGHCWVVGDNLAFSRDSRAYGPLPMGLIVGKVLFKFKSRCYFPWGFQSLQQGLQSFDECDVD